MQDKPPPFKDKENWNPKMLSNFLKFTKLVEIRSQLSDSKTHAFFTARCHEAHIMEIIAAHFPWFPLFQ